MPAPGLHSDAVLDKNLFAVSVPSPCDDGFVGIPCPVGTDENFRWTICDKDANYGLQLADVLSNVKNLFPLSSNGHTTWPELVAYLKRSSPPNDIESNPWISQKIKEFCREGPAADIAKGRHVWLDDCPVRPFHPGSPSPTSSRVCSSHLSFRFLARNSFQTILIHGGHTRSHAKIRTSCPMTYLRSLRCSWLPRSPCSCVPPFSSLAPPRLTYPLPPRIPGA